MRVLVVGGGGREHALAWHIARSPAVERLYAAPGNAGIGGVADCVGIAADDVAGLAGFAERDGIDLTVVGPEVPLVAGFADEFRDRGLPVFGPGAAGARLEGSKAWAKDLCERHGIPAARSRSFSEPGPAREYLEEFEVPYVIKADGLAAGKGVVIAEDRASAVRAIEACLGGTFGEAGATVLVEEFLSGREVSAFALTDGRDVLPLGMAQDFKRVGDGDTGPNTGGMGAYSPVPFVDEATRKLIEEEVLRATVRAMAAEGVPYCGVVYAGLMLTDEGPKVLEYNCRFGDPETQVIVPRLRSDLLELMLACVRGDLAAHRAAWKQEACVTLVLASGGYPGEYRTGLGIRGLEEANSIEGATVFHAGTARQEGRVVTAGGRVLAVSGLGRTVAEARAQAYEAGSLISFEGMQYRKDIAAKVTEPS